MANEFNLEKELAGSKGSAFSRGLFNLNRVGGRKSLIIPVGKAGMMMTLLGLGGLAATHEPSRRAIQGILGGVFSGGGDLIKTIGSGVGSITHNVGEYMKPESEPESAV